MSALLRLLDDRPGDDPWWVGARLGIVQANALLDPIGLVLFDHSKVMAALLALGTAFGWAGWARRDFRLRARPAPCWHEYWAVLPGGRTVCRACGADTSDMEAMGS